MYLIFTIVMIIVIAIFIKSAAKGWGDMASSVISGFGCTEKFVTHFKENHSGQYKDVESVDRLLDLWKLENKVISYSREPLSNGDYVYTITATKDFMGIMKQAACGLNNPFLFSFETDRALRNDYVTKKLNQSKLSENNQIESSDPEKDNASKEIICDYLHKSGPSGCSEIMRCNAALSELSIQKVTELCGQLVDEGRIKRVSEGKRTLYKI